MQVVTTESLVLSSTEVGALDELSRQGSSLDVSKSLRLEEYVSKLVNKAYDMGIQSGKLARGNLSP